MFALDLAVRMIDLTTLEARHTGEGCGPLFEGHAPIPPT